MEELRDRIDNIITDVWNMHREAKNMYDVRMTLEAYNGLCAARFALDDALRDQKVRQDD